MNMQTPIETETQKRDRVLAEWHEAAKALEIAKADEMEKRKLAFPVVFGPDAKEGTNRIALANGYSVKGIRKVNYKIDNDFVKVCAVEEAISKLGNEGPFIAARVLKRTYDFSASEYKKLDCANSAQAAAKKLIDSILTTKDGAPTLEIEPPK